MHKRQRRERFKLKAGTDVWILADCRSHDQSCISLKKGGACRDRSTLPGAHQFDPEGRHDLKQVINPSQFVSLSLGGTDSCVVVKVLRSCLSRELVRCDRRCDRSRPTIEVQCSLAWLKSARYKIGHTLIATHLRVIVIAIDLVSSSQCCRLDVWTVMHHDAGSSRQTT